MIHIQSKIDGVWLTRNKLSAVNMNLCREDAIAVASLTAQQWQYNYRQATLRLFDTETEREIFAHDETETSVH